MGRGRRRSLLDLVVEDVHPERGEGHVDEAEEDDRGENLTCSDCRGDGIGGAHPGSAVVLQETGGIPNRLASGVAHDRRLDDPGLASDLGGHPAELVGDERAGDREDEHPEQPAGGEQPLAPEQQAGEQRQADEAEAEADHDVVGDVRHQHRRPVLGAERVEAEHHGARVAGEQERQQAGDGHLAVDGGRLLVGQPR